jgi:hypothetical protein
MRKKLLIYLSMLVLAMSFFYSCQKEQSSSPEKYSTRLVPQHVAGQIARHISIDFLQKQQTSPTSREDITTDIPDREIRDSLTLSDSYENPALYVFNYADSGFVVISADLRHEPICAFIETGRFEEDTVPSMLIEWFAATVENIEMVRTEQYDNTERANYAWWDLISDVNMPHLNDALKTKPIDPPPPSCDENWTVITRGPLLQTAWGQWCTFNDNFPNQSCTGGGCWTGNVPTGCVATAMSQVIRYWANNNQFTYNYASMPATQGSAEVQRLMWDAAVSVNTSFGCNGSGADPSKIAPALRNVFSYASASYANVNSGSYMTVKSNIDRGMPVMLGGCAVRKKGFLGLWSTYSECHRWVCDGYWSAQNHCYGYLRFHMNWGWNEWWGGNNFNGWYAFNLWNPGTRNYQYSQSFVYDIRP